MTSTDQHQTKEQTSKNSFFLWMKSPWVATFSFIFGIVGVIGVGYTIYEYYRDKDPKLAFIEQSNTTVLDLKEDVSNLEIIYKGADIQKLDKNLRVITFKVMNTGAVNISENFYAQDSPLGFRLEGGNLAEPPQVIGASNEYLSVNLKLKADSSDQVTINDVQLDKAQWFTIKVLALTEKDSKPQIIPSGKISGITQPFKMQTDNEKETLTTLNLILSLFILFMFTSGLAVGSFIVRIQVSRAIKKINSKTGIDTQIKEIQEMMDRITEEENQNNKD